MKKGVFCYCFGERCGRKARGGGSKKGEEKWETFAWEKAI